ncbi:DUF3823 domain-containing protein [Catalinimonas sp. 4WD22]|uniref:DUF3823 domain-containing protein n=1 Tax=Catalinimonas locisalis TaxID=3133978 RepID=UPI0031019806
MKSIQHIYIVFLLAVVTLSGCELDNFEPPSSTLTGQIVYNDAPLGLRSDGVQLELWQYGYDDFEKIPVFVAQDGSFSAELFDGDYKLVLLRGNGPWLEREDSIDVNLNGSAEIDVAVNPYYIIGDENISGSGNMVNATFSVEGVNPVLGVEYVSLYIGESMIVDEVRKEGEMILPGAEVEVGTPLNLSAEIPASISGKGYVFARVGVKTAGVEEMLYSQVQKIEL